MPQHQGRRHEGARAEEADAHPQRQQQAHLRAETDVGKRPEDGRHDERRCGKGHGLARGGQAAADRLVDVTIVFFHGPADDVQRVIDPESDPNGHDRQRLEVDADVAHAHVGVHHTVGQEQADHHDQRGNGRAVGEHDDQEDGPEAQPVHVQVVLQNLLVGRRGHADQSAGQPPVGDDRLFGFRQAPVVHQWIGGDETARLLNDAGDVVALVVGAIERHARHRVAGVQEFGRLARRGAREIVEEQGTDPPRVRGNRAPAWLHVVERHVDGLDDVGQREAVSDVLVPLHVALEEFQRAQQVGVLQHFLVPPLDHDDERLDSAEVFLDFDVGLVVGRFQV